jgi:hypothetical protein
MAPDPPQHRLGFVFGLVIGLLLGARGGSAVAATSGRTMTGNGLRVDIDDSLLAGPGYRPLRLSVRPTAPVTADRTLSIELLFRRPMTPVTSYDLRVVRELDIPAGSGPTGVTLSVPPMVSHQYSLNIREDGVLLKALCVPWMAPAPSTYRNDWMEGIPEILFVDRFLPDTATLAAVLNVDKNRQPWQPAPPAGAPLLPNAASCLPQDLPDQWINYSGFDIVCISCEQLAALRSARPEAFRALVAWTAAGGNLWVFGLGSDWRPVGELDRLLDLPAQGGGQDKPVPPGWKAPENRLFGRTANTPAEAEDNSDTGAVVVTPAYSGSPAPMPPKGATHAKKKTSPKPPVRPPFVLRPLQAGLVVALAADKPFPGDEAEWRWLFDSMGEGRWQWYQRHGLSLQRENPDFLNFLIPGVGMAPVTEFCVLISVFVIAIGPVNYLVLRRRRKLHLLLLTIPASAAVVTGLLFGYALLADGLSVRVRARSVTNLDQRSGRAVCWTRLSYCAGLAPRGGLHFPADVAVLPLEQSPPIEFEQRPLWREVLWDEDQHLTSGWLPSRTPTQFVTVRARPSRCGLDVLDPAGPGQHPSLRNRLETPIKELLVCAKDGKYYWAEGVAPADTAPLEPISWSEAQSMMMGTLRQDKLDWPPGGVGASGSGVFGLGRNRYFYMRLANNGALSPPAQSTGRLEQMRTLNSLPPGSYMAVVERPPEVVLGVPAPREEPSSHVIIGNW